MRRTITRYPLRGLFKTERIMMPRGAVVRHTGTIKNEPWLWADEDPEEQREARYFTLAGEGGVIGPDWTYIGPILTEGFAWHVFEVPAEDGQRGRRGDRPGTRAGKDHGRPQCPRPQEPPAASATTVREELP